MITTTCEFLLPSHSQKTKRKEQMDPQRNAVRTNKEVYR
jgi:hypothetical protein